VKNWTYVKTLLIVAGLSSSLQAGRIVVNNDEWDLSNAGYSNAGNGPTSTFALNVAGYFTAGGPGNFLVYSSNFGLTESSLASTMTGAGNTWTVSTALAFTAANLAGYDGVFLAGFQAGFNAAEAAAYVNAGGNIYVAAGTASGFSAAGEAAFWNPFLNAFGLTLAPVYNGVGGVVPISSVHPVLAGVSQLYQNNGNSVSLTGTDAHASIILGTVTSANGLIGVYDNASSVPEPGTWLMLAAGLGALMATRRLRF
jgi:hypothetical protein